MDEGTLASAGTLLVLALPLVTALPIAAIAEDAGAPPRYWRAVGYGYLAFLAALLAAGTIGAIEDGDGVFAFTLILGTGAMLATQVGVTD